MPNARFQAAAADQIRALHAEQATRPVAEAALKLALALAGDPYRGERLRAKANLKPLTEAECRKIKFDAASRSAAAKPRYRYRLVYRIEPHEGAPETITVLAVGAKPRVYRDATRAVAARMRELALLPPEGTS